MASFTKLVCFFFLLTTLQTYARDSQFFSQVTRNRDYNTNPNPEYYNNHQENQATPFSKQQEEEEPTFVPQTTQVGYGLYGHETGLDAPTTTTTTAATTTNPSELYNMDANQYENQNNNNINNYENVEGNNSEGEPEFEELSETSNTNTNNNKDNIYNNVVPRRYVGGNTYNNNNNNNNNNKNNFESNSEAEPEFEELSETSYANNNNNNDDINNNVAPRRYVGGNNYNNNNNNNNNKNGHGEYYGGVGYNGGVERQGMSDTRYLENGKYYYDINAEKMTNPTNNNYNNDLSYNTNFENNLNNNNDNSNNNDNVNGVYPGYQSKFPKQDEFEFDDQP